MTETVVDPFGQWPEAQSSIAGLRGANGHIVLRLQSTRTRGPGRVERRVAVTAPTGGGDVETIIRFEARPDRQYAIHARASSGSDIVADAVTVTIDQPLTSTAMLAQVARQTERVRRAATRRPLRHGRLRSLEALGLVRGGEATLTDPVSQMVTSAQLAEPAYERLTALIGQRPTSHRKQWEFAYILAVLDHLGHLAPGRRGLGFGTGLEPLPSTFAAHGIEVMATDAPIDAKVEAGWASTNQHAHGLESVRHADLVGREAFDRLVRFRPVDMNRIPDDLRGFDFCWSACAFEHLGSIDAGLAFVENSLATLRPGGVAVHTTELNLSSNESTVEDPNTVLFRWRDFERLALRLRRLGHRVLPIRHDRGDGPLDDHIDMPPYAHDVHLKLQLTQYVTTSFGIAVIRDGLAVPADERRARGRTGAAETAPLPDYAE